MNKNVTIVDPDYRYARMMSGRLKLYLPSINVSECSSFLSRSSRLADNEDFAHSDIIVYDNLNISPEWLIANKIDLPSTHMIPLRQSSEHTRISASHICKNIQMLLQDELEDSKRSYTANNERKTGKLIYLISYCHEQEREIYIKNSTASFSEFAHPIFRIDLMAGIKIMSNTSSDTGLPANLSSSGMNQLLSCPHLLDKSMTDLLPYCHPDCNGHYSLGRPLRSDDTINTDIHDLEKIMTNVRKRIEQADDCIYAITVIDGLSFSKLHILCPLAHEVHIVLGDEKQYADPLFRFELDDLFSKLSPLQKKYIQCGERKIL